MDVLTVPGPSPDWWFNPDRAKDLSDTEAVIAWHARCSDLVDWLLGAAVQSAYPVFAADQMRKEQNWRRDNDKDWEIAPQFDSLGARYWVQYRRSGGTEWAVLAMLFPMAEDQAETADGLYNIWLVRTLNCVASPAEYAAFPTAYFERSTRDVWDAGLPKPDDLIELLPPRMQDAMIDQAARGFLARKTAAGYWHRKLRQVEETPQDLAALAAMQRSRRDDASYTLNEMRLMFVDNMDALADLLAENGSVQYARSIDLLSAAHLRALVADTRLPQTVRVNLARVAFLRLLALGSIREAQAALRNYLALYPTARFDAEAAMAKASEPEVKLALAALTMPLSVRYYGHWAWDMTKVPGFGNYFGTVGQFSADLPDWLRTGGGLQVDVERLLQVGQFWFSQKGYTERGIRRLHDRRMEIALPVPRFVGFPPQGPYDPGVPFGRLVALDELGRLGPDTGLSQRLSEVVIAWADAGSDTIPEMILQQNGAMPQALRQIVQLNRYRTRGDVGGVFAGKAAFRLLHDRFPLSAAARATPYWYKCTSPYCDR